MGDWCDLPPELLDLIAKSLDIPSDTRRFRSVCGSWRWAVPLPLPIELDMPPMKFLRSNFHQCQLRLAKHTFFHLSDPSASSSVPAGWLIKTEEHKPGAFHLFHPFTRTSTKISPPTSNLKLDVNNVKIQELGHEYVLHNTCDADHDLCNMKQEKVAFKLLPSSNTNHDYVILSTHNTGKLLLYRSSWSKSDNSGRRHNYNEGEWEFLDDLNLGYDERSIFVNDWSLHYVDVVEYQGTLYAVTNSGRTVAIRLDVNQADERGPEAEGLSSSVTVTLLTKSMIGGDRKCLVKSKDDLLMVDLYTCPTQGVVKVHAVEIFKLDKEEQRWILLKELGDRALFLSNHSCFAATGLPGCKGNSIYFHLKNSDYNKQGQDQDQIRKHGSSGDDFNVWRQQDQIDVFDYDKGTSGFLPEYLQDSQLFSWPPPVWVTLTS
uniref:KIB1-4 beta-propeller domain-containing protein n=2 Tax=Opuntia streptacantha TaxID=393608 RepID=A0A7C8ZGP6_OPUST